MGKNRDKLKDLEMTRKVLAGEVEPVKAGVNWLGHLQGNKDFELDLCFLRGVPDSELKAVRDSYTQHKHDLKVSHGLGVERDERGYWKFTGEAHIAGKKVERRGVASADSDGEELRRKKITDEQYRAGYEQGKLVFEAPADDKAAMKAAALDELSAMGLNRVSGANMFYITDGLLSGKVFKRALKDEAYGWYLEWILRDYGSEGLKTALKSGRLHLEYRESGGADRWRLREILKNYEKILKGEPPEGNGRGVSNEDARGGNGPKKKYVLATVRYGQPEFRKNLLRVYRGRCAVTGCAVERALEAAHIEPYADEGESRVSNGILMRSDIHALFDAGLLGIDPATYMVKLSAKLYGEVNYWRLQGVKIHLPDIMECYPDKAKLAVHLAGVI